MQPLTWGEFLHLLVGPTAATVAGLLISLIIEYWPKFQAVVEPKFKTAIFFGLCMLIPLLATAMGIATGEFGAWGDWQTTWWPALVSGWAAAGIGSLVHQWKPDKFKDAGHSRGS